MNLNDGARMMRTDSLGQLQTPNQLYIGSTMRAGSLGSPMLVNFGNPMSNSNPLGSDSNPNTMVGVVSWYSAQASAGANDYTVGGSCFALCDQSRQPDCQLHLRSPRARFVLELVDPPSFAGCDNVPAER